MKWCTPLLLVLAASTLFLCCSRAFNVSSNAGAESAGQGDLARTGRLEYTGGIIDTVKVRKDPKAGWFGPKLRDVYMQGEDTPVLYCDSGPPFPTGKYVTIFYHEVMSRPESSACKAAVAVLDGEATLKDGKPVTLAELARIREQEEHFQHMAFGRQTDNFELAWHKPKPIGDPCPDTSGTPQDVADRYRDQNCSIAVAYDNGLMLFVNWKVVGIDDAVGAGFGARDVIQIITAKYGGKYVVYRKY